MPMKLQRKSKVTAKVKAKVAEAMAMHTSPMGFGKKK